MDPNSADHDPAHDDAEIQAFWEVARVQAHLNAAPGFFGPTVLESVPPPAWSFGATEDQANQLGVLVRDGVKTATASALWDYEATGERLPQAGDLSIVLDGENHPIALIVTTAVSVVPFDEVSEHHAFAEGEGDRSLAHWREVHERFFTDVKDHDRAFSATMPVVCEEFEVLHVAD